MKSFIKELTQELQHDHSRNLCSTHLPARLKFVAMMFGMSFGAKELSTAALSFHETCQRVKQVQLGTQANMQHEKLFNDSSAEPAVRPPDPLETFGLLDPHLSCS